jgi:hypothetical protein
MQSEIEIRLHRVTLTPDIKGKKTLPTVGCYDSKFQERYVPAVKTDLAETFKRAREAIGVRRVEKAA